ncbi:MAG TPA: response regulator [Usitatibacter sp.]|nr:response regulator [Usitatibacter sp.]
MATPRVIVVDFPRDGAAALAAYLGAQGCDARTAADGRQALELIRDWPADGVVSEIELPQVSGLELARSLRYDFGKSIRLVALTAWAGRRDRDLALSAGFDDVVAKPADPSAIALALDLQSMALIARARQATVQQLNLTLDLAESFQKLQRIVPPNEADVVARLAGFVRNGLSRAAISAADRERLGARLDELHL